MVWESSNYNYIRFHEIRIFNVGLCGNIGEEFFFGMPTKALEIQKAQINEISINYNRWFD